MVPPPRTRTPAVRAAAQLLQVAALVALVATSASCGAGAAASDVGARAASTAVPPSCEPVPSRGALPPAHFWSARDVGLHAARYETDYYAGTVADVASGRTFGVMFAMMAYVARGECRVVRPALGMVAVSDVAGNRFLQQSAIAATAPVVAAPAASFKAGVWSMRQPDASDWRRVRLEADLPKTAAGAVSLSLDTLAHGPLLGMAENGVLATNLTVPRDGCAHVAQSNLTAAGTLSLDGREFRVAGTLWVQHMWNSMSTSRHTTWHWFFVRLSDGWSLQLTMFDDAGHPGNAALSYMNLVPPSGSRDGGGQALSTMYAPQVEYGWTVEGGRPWTSPATGTLYNTTNRIRCEALSLDVVVSTRILDNEVRTPVGSYYEGASTVAGTHLGLPVTGDAFTERVLPHSSGGALWRKRL